MKVIVKYNYRKHNYAQSSLIWHQSLCPLTRKKLQPGGKRYTNHKEVMT